MEKHSSPLTVPSWRTLARWSLLIFAVWLVSWLLWKTGSGLVPFIMGLIMAYLLMPLVDFLGRYVPRWASILIIYTLGLGAFVGALMFIVPSVASQIGKFAQQLPEWWTKTAQPFFNQQLQWYNTEVPEDWKAEVDKQITNTSATIKENASTYVTGVLATLFSGVTTIFKALFFLAGFLVIPFWLFYVLMDAEKGKGVVDRLLPPQIRADFWAVVGIFDRIFSAYIRGQLTLALSVGLMSFAGLWIIDLVFGFDIQYKLVLSIVAGFTELIPVIGPILGAIPAVIVGLFTSPMAALAVGVLYIIIQQVENNFLVPRIIGGVVEIHAAVLMVLLVVAASVSGLLGVIVSAPLAAVARDLYKYISNRLRDPDDPRYLPAGVMPTPPISDG